MFRRLLFGACLIVMAGTFLSGCSGDDDTIAPVSEDLRTRFELATLGPIPYPPDNPPRQERIALGRLLFYDPVLGGEQDVACGTCHHPAFAFADRRQFGAGTSGAGLGPERLVSISVYTNDAVSLEPRNSPTIFNTAFNGDENGESSHMGFQFWDGRVMGLEEQATKPITSRVEMRGDAYPGTDAEAANVALDSVLVRLRKIPEYVTRFTEAFPDEAGLLGGGLPELIITKSTYGRAIAAFERELVTRNSPYDRYVRGDDDALDDMQKLGLEIFFTKGRCSTCHNGSMFSNYEFFPVGVPQEGVGKAVIPGDDAGREEFTGDPSDRFAFRTPTLRNVELTPPYMHDGVFENLEQVVEFYDDGCRPRHPSVTDEMMDSVLTQPLGLTDAERQALVEFMKALTDPGTELDPFLITVPERVPSGLVPVFGVRALDASVAMPAHDLFEVNL